MKRREGKGAPSTDLLVCFPTRAHLTLMPKPICSPARPSESKKSSHHHLRLKNSSIRGGGSGGGHGSPFLYSKSKQMGSDISEPTSPKVTCAGQIKVRPRPGPCKNWQSVMEEIERLHNNRKQKKKPTWVEALGFKKEIMQFLTCLRSVRFDFRCFGVFPTADITSDDDDDNDEDDHDHDQKNQKEDEQASSKAVFSKWFMVLQENQNCGIKKEEKCIVSTKNEEPCAPPANALLLMRCRSAPAKSWQEERKDQEDDDNGDEEEEEEEEKEVENLGLFEEEKRKKRESLEQLMKHETEFHKFSSDIAKETWVVGGNRDPLSRSRSWKR